MAKGLTGARTNPVGTRSNKPGMETKAIDLRSFFHITGQMILPLK